MTTFSVIEPQRNSALIKVMGVGGCGGNAINHMVTKGIDGVEFISANTDAKALKDSLAPTQVQLGQTQTRGLGAGAKPEVGRDAAREDTDRILEMLDGTDMLFITAGMGGGTGTGAAPVVAQIAKQLQILTVAVVTRPFKFEGKRELVAQQGIEELAKVVDSLIIVPNDKLLEVLGRNARMKDAFAAANDVLFGAVSGIAEVINRTGHIGVDFADVRTVMSEPGMAMMGTAVASGEDRARVAAERAVKSPLLEDVDLQGARAVLVNFTSNEDVSLGEIEDAMSLVHTFTAKDATVIFGHVIDDTMGDEMRVTVIATGLGGAAAERRKPTLVPKAFVRTGTDGEPVATDAIGARPAFGAPLTSSAAAPSSSAFDVNNLGAARTPPPGVLVRPTPTPSAAASNIDIPTFLRKQAD